jgi:hypothetical protein
MAPRTSRKLATRNSVIFDIRYDRSQFHYSATRVCSGRHGQTFANPTPAPSKLSRTRRIHPTIIHVPKNINKTKVIPEPNTKHRTIEKWQTRPHPPKTEKKTQRAKTIADTHKLFQKILIEKLQTLANAEISAWNQRESETHNNVRGKHSNKLTYFCFPNCQRRINPKNTCCCKSSCSTSGKPRRRPKAGG